MKRRATPPRLPALFVLALLAGAFYTAPLSSQESGGPAGGQTVSPVVRSFEWRAVADAEYYELSIQREGPNGAFRDLLSEKTRSISVRLLLDPGRYRYRVTVYNIFDMASAPTRWSYFDIIPEAVETVPPQQAPVEPPARPVAEPPAQAMEEPLGEDAAEEPSGDGDVEDTGDVSDRDTSDRDASDSDSTETLPDEKPPKSVGFDLSFLYAPLIPVYGALNDHFDSDVFFAGAEVRAAFIPYIRESYSIGAELEGGWTDLSQSIGGNPLEGRLFTAGANAIFQKYLIRRIFALTFRAGGGASFFQDLHFTETLLETPALSWFIHASGGLSFQLFIREWFFFDAGAQFIHIFSEESPQSAYVRPSAGFGLRF
jgi:hypothetical protein